MAGRLVWDQDIGGSIPPSPTKWWSVPPLHTQLTVVRNFSRPGMLPFGQARALGGLTEQAMCRVANPRPVNADRGSIPLPTSMPL